MATVSVDLSDDEFRQLEEAAQSRGVEPAALIERWVRERLVHERERAAGGGRPMSPRARREREGND
jgi:hypothetical protein